MHVEGFDNIEDMFAAMDAAEASANERLTPGQVRLRDDIGHTTYWVRIVPEYDGLIIYGKVRPLADLAGFDFDVCENRARGYLTGVAYSRDTPTGEHGDTHVSQVIPITKVEFTMAQDMDWPDMETMASTPEGRILGGLLYGCERGATR